MKNNPDKFGLKYWMREYVEYKHFFSRNPCLGQVEGGGDDVQIPTEVTLELPTTLIQKKKVHAIIIWSFFAAQNCILVGTIRQSRMKSLTDWNGSNQHMKPKFCSTLRRLLPYLHHTSEKVFWVHQRVDINMFINFKKKPNTTMHFYNKNNVDVKVLDQIRLFDQSRKSKLCTFCTILWILHREAVIYYTKVNH